MNFLRKHSYTKRTDGKTWTKNTVIQAVADELAELQPQIHAQNTLTFRARPDLRVEFIASNFAEANALELNASVFMDRAGKIESVGEVGADELSAKLRGFLDTTGRDEDGEKLDALE